MFKSCFQYFGGEEYRFVGNDGFGTPVSYNETLEIQRRLYVEMALVGISTVLSTLYGFYPVVARLAGSATTVPGWLDNQTVVYAVLTPSWLLTWLNAVVAWGFIARRLSGRPASLGDRPARNPFLPCTRPTQVAVFGFLMVGVATHGFGTGCFQFRGVGFCDYSKIEHTMLEGPSRTDATVREPRFAAEVRRRSASWTTSAGGTDGRRGARPAFL